MKENENLYETHKKGEKNDGVKPSDRTSAKGNKKLPPKFENFNGEKIE